MINVLGTLGFTTICRQNFLKSLKKKVFSGPLELNWRAVGWHLLIKIRAGNSRLSYPFQLLFKPFVFLKWSLLYQVFLKGLPSAGALLKKLTTCFLSIFHHRWIHWCQKWVTQVAPPSFILRFLTWACLFLKRTFCSFIVATKKCME